MESREARINRKELNKRRTDNDDEEDKGMVILVLKDSRSKVALARVVPKEGRNQNAVERLQKDIAKLGYKKLILKCDKEVAIIALKEAVKHEILEESPEYDSMGNGKVYKQIQEVEGQIGATKLNLEANVGGLLWRGNPRGNPFPVAGFPIGGLGALGWVRVFGWRVARHTRQVSP